jgi:hypothetical protein
MYDAEGLALVALFAEVARRFAAWNFPAWKARAGLLYCEQEIRSALRGRAASVLVLDAWRGTIRVERVAPADAEAIPLQPTLARMRQVIARTRAAQPAVWTGREFTETPTLMKV